MLVQSAAVVVVVSSSVELIVPLVASPSTGPIVCPASVDTLVQVHESFSGEDTKNSPTLRLNAYLCTFMSSDNSPYLLFF